MKLRYWLSSKKRQMAKLHDLQRQLQEAWNEKDILEDYYMDEWEKSNSLTAQLHRVARERDQERKKRIDAEVAHLDSYLDRREKNEEDRAADKSWLADVDNEEE